MRSTLESKPNSAQSPQAKPEQYQQQDSEDTARHGIAYPSSHATTWSLISFLTKRLIQRLGSIKHTQIIHTPEYRKKVSLIHISMPTEFPSSSVGQPFSLGAVSSCIIP